MNEETTQLVKFGNIYFRAEDVAKTLLCRIDPVPQEEVDAILLAQD